MVRTLVFSLLSGPEEVPPLTEYGFSGKIGEIWNTVLRIYRDLR